MTKFPRAPRRLDTIFPRNPLYFVTCCTYRRRPYLASERVHSSFVKFGQRAQVEFGIAVGRYVILPDHLYLFVALPDNVKLGDWIGTLKRFLAQAVEVSCSSGPIWQRGFFDHLLRSSESYSEKWNYVRENPVRAGLVPTRMIGDTVVRSSPFNMTNSASGFAVFLLRSAKANVAKTRAPRRPEVGGYNPRAFE